MCSIRFCGSIVAAALAVSSASAGSNLLSNPSFEAGAPGFGVTGWITFGNVFTEAVTPLSGSQVGKMFGGFSGGFNVGGMFQEFPAAPGSEWALDVWTRHNTGDSLSGVAGSGNWVVQKIVFKDAADVEIGAAESVVLDGTFPVDVWNDNAAVLGTAPANTVQVEAFVLFLQPAFDGGAALIDDAYFAQIPEPASALLLAIAGLLVVRRR